MRRSFIFLDGRRRIVTREYVYQIQNAAGQFFLAIEANNLWEAEYQRHDYCTNHGMSGYYRLVSIDGEDIRDTGEEIDNTKDVGNIIVNEIEEWRQTKEFNMLLTDAMLDSYNEGRK